MPVGKAGVSDQRETDGNTDAPAWTDDTNVYGKPGPNTSFYGLLVLNKCPLEL